MEPEVERVDTQALRNLVPISTNTALVKPAVTTEEAVAAWEAYLELKKAIQKPEDVQVIKVQGADRPFLKKSYWRKIANFFNLTDEIRSEKMDNYEDSVFVWRITVRATAPNGRYAEGTGACSSDEQWTPSSPADKIPPKVRHNIYAIAHTRAKNRAISDLVGGGEVSYEEMTGQDGVSGTKPVSTEPVLFCPTCNKPMNYISGEKNGKLWEKFSCSDRNCKDEKGYSTGIWGGEAMKQIKQKIVVLRKERGFTNDQIVKIATKYKLDTKKLPDVEKLYNAIKNEPAAEPEPPKEEPESDTTGADEPLTEQPDANFDNRVMERIYDSLDAMELEQSLEEAKRIAKSYNIDLRKKSWATDLLAHLKSDNKVPPHEPAQEQLL